LGFSRYYVHCGFYIWRHGLHRRFRVSLKTAQPAQPIRALRSALGVPGCGEDFSEFGL
jgi:hypothetical protein